MFEEDYPANPTARSIKERLNASPDGIVHLDARFDLFGDMTPRQSDDSTKDGRNDVNDHSEPP